MTMSKKMMCLLLAPMMIYQLANAQQSPSNPPDEDQAIKLKADLVELRAVVTDRKGQPVDNLKREDFEILEKGKPQDISFFSMGRVGAKPDKTAGPATQQITASKSARTIVFFVDTLHMSASNLMGMKSQLRQFVDEQVSDDDVVAIVTTSGTLGILQQFLKERRLLKYAIDKIVPFSRTESFFTPYLAARVTAEDSRAIAAASQILQAEEGLIDPRFIEVYVRTRAAQVIAEENHLRRATLLTLKAVSERLADWPGQRIIVALSEGFTTLEDRGSNDNDDLQAVTGRAARSGVVIYSINAKGLATPAFFSASHRLTDDPAGNLSFYLSSSESDQQGVLRTLAYTTGGEAYLNTNDIKGALQKMLESNRTYYEIAYYPATDNNMNKFRNVTIRLKTHPEYTIRAQKGYLPFERKKADIALTPRQKLLQAMIAPLPITDIGVSSQADFFESEADDAQVSLQVHFDGERLQYHKQEALYLLNCEVAMAIYDASGNVVDSSGESLKATLTARQLELVRQNGFRNSKRLRLKPGLYQIRIGIRDSASGLIGTAMSWVEVPDLRKGKPALSSLFLTKAYKEKEGGETVTAADKGNSQPELLLGRTAFKSGDTAIYRLLAYNTSTDVASEPGSMLKVEVIQNEAPVFKSDWQALASRIVRRDKKGLELGGQVILRLSPGVYELRVTAKDAKSKKTTQSEVPFEIEP